MKERALRTYRSVTVVSWAPDAFLPMAFASVYGELKHPANDLPTVSISRLTWAASERVSRHDVSVGMTCQRPHYVQLGAASSVPCFHSHRTHRRVGQSQLVREVELHLNIGHLRED